MGLPLFAAQESSAPSLAASSGARRRICIQTFGCSHNASDGEYLAGQLVAAGYAVAGDATDADLLLINSCTVKGPSQDSFLSAVRAAKAKGVPLVVAGCVPQADPHNKTLAGLSVIGVQQLESVVDIVERTLVGQSVRATDKSHVPSLALPKLRKNRLIEIIPISLGCLNACAYCKTKHARGHLRSYPLDEILARLRTAVAEGVAQVWLTSEDSGAYGRDIGASLPQLLDAILAELSPGVMLRVGMANPPYILEHLDAIACILNHRQVFSFVHLPAQSGSDSVLGAMKREYSVADFQLVVDDLRARVPGLTVATDIICGFPTETQDDFAMTLELVERNRFPILNISQFYPRPGTPAARMRLLPTQEVKRRSTELTRLFKSQRPYDALVGTEQEVWISTVEDGQLVGHTKSYVLAFLPLDHALLGKKVRARITHAGKHFVRGEVV